MKTFVVWVLYISATTSQTYESSISLAVIDNIAVSATASQWPRNCLKERSQIALECGVSQSER